MEATGGEDRSQISFLDNNVVEDPASLFAAFLAGRGYSASSPFPLRTSSASCLTVCCVCVCVSVCSGHILLFLSCGDFCAMAFGQGANQR